MIERAFCHRFRVLDVLLTLVIAPVALPLTGVIALCILADSPGPIFYRCRRIGRGGRPFVMYKFRKMRREATGPSLTAFHDERFTPLGRFLTESKLDELPQLWNVLKGNMRLVGPRPEVDGFVHLYPDAYGEILEVAPGITGLAQLEYVNEGRLLSSEHDSTNAYALEILPRKVELDRRYLERRSLVGDIAILARTAWLPGHAMMRRLFNDDDAHRDRAPAYWGVLLIIGAAALAAAYIAGAGALMP